MSQRGDLAVAAEAVALRQGTVLSLLSFARITSEAFSIQSFSVLFPCVPNHLLWVLPAGRTTAADANESRLPAFSLPCPANELSGVGSAMENLTRTL